MRSRWQIWRPRTARFFLWRLSPAPRGLRLIKAWGFQYKSVAFVWLKKNRKADSWFYGLAFGRGEMRSLPAGNKRAYRSGRWPISTSLSFHPLKPTAKSRTRPGKRLLPSWAICPGGAVRKTDAARLGCVGKRGGKHRPGLWDKLSRSLRGEKGGFSCPM